MRRASLLIALLLAGCFVLPADQVRFVDDDDVADDDDVTPPDDDDSTSDDDDSTPPDDDDATVEPVDLILLDPASGSIDFGLVPTGTWSNAPYTLENLGPTDLAVNASSNEAHFNIDTIPFVVPALGQYDGFIDFAPAQEVPYSGLVTFTHTGTGPSITVDVTGIGDVGLTEVFCGDGVDDDSDGVADCGDSDCTTQAPCYGSTEVCNDGEDNDADGAFDCSDPDCFAAAICGGLETQCADGINDDGDSGTDCLDPDCLTDPACAGIDPCCLGSGTGSASCTDAAAASCVCNADSFCCVDWDPICQAAYVDNCGGSCAP